MPQENVGNYIQKCGMWDKKPGYTRFFLFQDMPGEQAVAHIFIGKGGELMQIGRPVPRIRVIPVGNVSDHRRAYARVVDIIRQACPDRQENPQEMLKEINMNPALGKKKDESRDLR
ncbi:F0F1-type ATP synthase, alpha subunit [Moorella thermoacetica Y72]|uniref:F0F1-type ATP synthase, alpha subunit n=2 Tax=Neomoorella thermoacetica TaxID=1525 RepID=A0A0S6UIQ6_NEOTH|nr:F0F1-type ATP synthase, alpha subunit [Moorella thermoacetica Y72]